MTKAFSVGKASWREARCLHRPKSNNESSRRHSGSGGVDGRSLVAGMDSDLVFYQFSRSKVKRGDFQNFLSLYAPDKLRRPAAAVSRPA